MIEINNLTSFKIEEKDLKSLGLKILKKESGKGFKKDLSLALVAPLRIKGLNRKYRKKDKATDVLSFEDKETWGEIVICPEQVRKNARQSKSSFKKELSRVFVHGVLHLLGYDHMKEKDKKEMEKKEQYYLNI